MLCLHMVAPCIDISSSFSAFWSFLYFVGFCYLTNQWSKSKETNYGVNNMQAAIAFSFFAIFPWVSHQKVFYISSL